MVSYKTNLWYNLSYFLETYYCLSTTKKLPVSWKFSGPYGVTKYGSGWRRDVVNQCLEFGWCDAPRLDGSRRRGWRNLSEVMTEEGLAWLVIPQPPLHCRPCCCFWCCCCCCWWWWWRSQSCRRCCCCGRLCCQSCGCCRRRRRWLMFSLLCSHRHDCTGGYWWWWWWWWLVHTALFSTRLEQTHCGAAFVACNCIEIGPFCFTSTEARWLIRDGDRGKGTQEWRLVRGYRPKKTGETVDRRQNNGSVTAVSPRHCPVT